MIQAFLAYLLWGAFPLYFPLLQPAGPVEILAHRFVWTLVVMAVILLVMRKWRELREASRRTWGIVAAAAFFIAVNWGVYVYAVNSGHIAEAALGYFINPLVSVLLGVIFLKERLSVLQKWSVGIAAIAVIVLTIGVGRPPVIALLLAFSFGFYGLMKKRVDLSATASLTAESAIMTPLAIAYLAFLGAQGTGTFTAHGPGHALLLVSAGFATAVPLLLFGIGAKKIPLSTIGLMQYITPMMQMSIAIFIAGEHLEPARWIGYVIIWVAVAVFVADIVLRHGRNRRRRRAERLGA
ncbi:MAG TPA: EamA family transporter RarD [Corynebacterium sp.]|uniref:EamA family transporter RarD n=1 Tax=Corynebacterium sp. TaxID=1720 RepID=UPI0017A8C3C5|nr:EamA family transporter RarD [Corynebacterium sp.]MDY0113835.1 EamA family transporter RarD [Corynebacterium sp.]HHT32699.1 EamA family transporter RarD [Corynebacterium sp.]